MRPQDFEKLGTFYLGRPYDLAARAPRDGLLLYDSKDLVTHAVCVGMTGSGKTGLCIALLEEAGIDGIPAIVIDPKGDLPNLLLTFPGLRPEDFEPWVDAQEAAAESVSTAELASRKAALWREGLAGWGQDGERIRRFREAVDLAVYTPGSTAGLPVSILGSFDAPPAAVADDPEALRERIITTASALLGLVGVEADPVRSREHILISTVLERAWSAGGGLDLAGLIRQVQDPGVERIGVMDLESFYPSKERFGLALALNNLLASPGFSAWMEGEPLDVGAMLHTPEGKPRMSIFSIAHLSDPERMFFVSLLLSEVLAWTRAQPGTSSLRAILYMDEIFGYFPPVANPPSKTPLLTLLKQARGFGVGVVLATQNPVDLDYKGLANTGTWFIGRLQTERDKARVLEGLEGAAAGTGLAFDRRQAEEVLAGLAKRVFLMNNVHEDGPEVFESRWVMSYLAGPMTRTQIKALMQARPPAAPEAGEAPPAARRQPAGRGAAGAPPVVPPAVPQWFLPVRGGGPEGASLVYRPMVFGSAEVLLADPKLGVDLTREVNALARVTAAPVPVDWDGAELVELTPADLESEPEPGAGFGDLPAAAARPASYERWSRDLARWLYGSEKLELLRSPALKAVSKPDEPEGEFRARLGLAARERRDAMVEEIRKRYATKAATLEERLRRSEQAVDRESGQAREAGMQTALSVGATVLGAILGRKKVSAASLGRATTAARGAARGARQTQDIRRAKETLEAVRGQLADLEARLEEELRLVHESVDPKAEKLETVTVKPKKTNISVRLVALAWAPVWEGQEREPEPAW